MENHFYHIRCPPLNVTIFITHMINCVMGATPMIRALATHIHNVGMSIKAPATIKAASPTR